MRDRSNVKPSIEAEEWSGSCEKDGIYFFAVDFHCFVLLYYHQENFAYFADGSNQFQTNVKLAKQFKASSIYNSFPCHLTSKARITAVAAQWL